VLMKMKKWSEALTDLEVELAANPDNEKVHQVLAEVYEHLGSAELAAQHRSLAQAKAKPGVKVGNRPRP